MKKLFLLFILVNSLTVFSQEEKRSYFFDYYTIKNIKNYLRNFNGKIVNLYNTKDSTYTLYLDANNKKAELLDFKKRLFIHFEMDFNFEKIEDLNKLKNSKIHYNVSFYKYPNGNKKLFKNIEFQNDSITNNKTIVHIKEFKNKKMKKLVDEHFYVFGNNTKLIETKDNTLKEYLINKCNVTPIKNQFLEKIIHLDDNKITEEVEFLETKEINFNYDFKIDSVYKIHINVY